MQGDDIQKQRQHAEHWCSTVVTFESHAALALWVIAEQLFELTHHLAAFREVIDPAAGENFPAVVRIRQEEK